MTTKLQGRPSYSRLAAQTTTMFPSLRQLRPGEKLGVVLVGIAGTSRDILLAPWLLKSSALAHDDIRDAVSIEVVHHKFILPRNVIHESEELARAIAARRPGLVGFSTYCWNIDAVKQIATWLRELTPDAKILLGGPEIDIGDMARGIYDAEPYDFLIVGEGEPAFLAILRCFLRPEAVDGARIARLGFNTPGGFTFTPLPNTSVGLIRDLVDLPSPFLTGAIPAELLADPQVCVNLETQRGCNLRCAYCLYHANFPTIRYRDPETVLQELSYVNERGVAHFRITDANFFSNHDFATTLLRGMVERRLHMSMFIEVIPVFVDEMVASLMVEYQALSLKNQILVGVGLQTINERSLKAIHRNISVHHFDRAFDLLNKAKVIIKTDLILGLPFETRKTYMQLMEYIGEKMRYGYNYLSLALLRLLPGTELKEIAERYKLVVDTRDSDHFVYYTPDISREELVECLRISSVALRFFHTQDDQKRIHVRDFYFETKDRLGISHVEMLSHFVSHFLHVLQGSNSDFVQPDFPNAEHYWYFDNHQDISDDLIFDELKRMSATA